MAAKKKVTKKKSVKRVTKSKSKIDKKSSSERTTNEHSIERENRAAARDQLLEKAKKAPKPISRSESKFSEYDLKSLKGLKERMDFLNSLDSALTVTHRGPDNGSGEEFTSQELIEALSRATKKIDSHKYLKDREKITGDKGINSTAPETPGVKPDAVLNFKKESNDSVNLNQKSSIEILEEKYCNQMKVFLKAKRELSFLQELLNKEMKKVYPTSPEIKNII